jgi:hypothetical protein
LELQAKNLADWRIREHRYKDDLTRPSVKADFQLPGNFVGVAFLGAPNAVSMPDAKLRQGPDWPEGCRTGPEPSPGRLQIRLSTAN